MSTTPVIALAGLAKEYPGTPPLQALRNVDLSIDAGEFVTIQGRSGSGKSTLLNILGLLDTATAGTFHLDGVDVDGLSDRERTWLRGSSIGFVFQSFQLVLDRAASENVAMALLYRGVRSSEAHARSLEALDRVGMAARSDQHPSRMSGGERQRVAIARAIVGAPAVLLCDEPTGNLDIESSEAVLEVMQDLNAAGATIVLITHEPEIAAAGTRSLYLRDGVLADHLAPRPERSCR